MIIGIDDLGASRNDTSAAALSGAEAVRVCPFFFAFGSLLMAYLINRKTKNKQLDKHIVYTVLEYMHVPSMYVEMMIAHCKVLTVKSSYSDG
jgi:hypothetical protein